MLERILTAGSGGQGIIFFGKTLAAIAVEKIPHVTFFPSYGAEVRGGTSNCQVVFSSDEISSPVSKKFDSMILLNQPSADKFLCRAGKDCLIIFNSSLCECKAPPGARCISVNATERANQLGNPCVANIIMLGAYLARKPLIPPDAVEQCIQQILQKKNSTLVDMNIKAFHAGLKL